MSNLTVGDVLEYQERKSNLNPFTATEFKKLGRELRDKFDLTDIEAISLLNGRDCLNIIDNVNKRNSAKGVK